MRISTSIYVYASDFFSQCTTQISKAKFIDLARTSSNFDDAAIQFQHRVLKNSGIGDETYLPRSVFLPGRHKVTLKDGREEAAMVMFGAVDDLLATTGVRLNDIKILIVNYSILNTTPSLSAMVINHYKLRHEVKEVMKASFEAFLMVLLAGGGGRIFCKSDQELIEEDFDSLKRVFSTCREGLITEEVVEREAETVEGVVGLMGQGTEQLVEDFSIVACEASGMGVMGEGQMLPMPPTTGKWNRADPNTILRVLCHRNDPTANQFLKRTFQLAKRK
ncbi:hypothetical protein HHK36_012024 [Tetracentron sinense]|uniref:MHD2 domain-containing protein n=1 Tax=Tetracentron sinense TaxID=13715 RepID=A0A835DHS1_TETSI|nr:hypothetical protein HHK36_012024 [Tetracentron sinense]